MKGGQTLGTWLSFRIASGLATVLFLTVVVFVATQGLPSDPARVILGAEAPEATVEMLRHQLGLDRPLAEQYVHWLSATLSGDMGLSLSSRREVSEIVLDRLFNTIVLVGLVISVALPSALALGITLALRAHSAFDRAVVSTLIALKATPVFAIAIGLVMLCSTTVFSFLPAVSLVDPSQPLLSQLQYLVLPVLTLVLSTVPYLARLVRASMIEVLSADYLTHARLRGIPPARLIVRHALPNALIPAVQGAALTSSVLLGGTLVVEVLFNYPGLGSLLNAAVEARDLPIVQSSVLILATGVVFINLAADLGTALLTPRLRSSGDSHEKPNGVAAKPATAAATSGS